MFPIDSHASKGPPARAAGHVHIPEHRDVVEAVLADMWKMWKDKRRP
jgi:hypothetical protein